MSNSGPTDPDAVLPITDHTPYLTETNSSPIIIGVPHMPVSQKPRRPYAGNKYLLSSKEYQAIQVQLGQLLNRVQAMQEVLINTLIEMRSPAPLLQEPVPGSDGTIDQKTWDEYEADMAQTVLSLAPEALEEAANEDTFVPEFLAGARD